jgi:hypothetical protein
MRHIVKLVAINALALFIVFNVVIWTICLATSVWNAFGTIKQQTVAREIPNKARLPNYAGVDWAPTYFQEFEAQDTRYVSYYEWRRKAFEGKTITVVGPYGQRRTVGPTDATKPLVYFFGGSTIWGTGADDANTIPSQFAQLSGLRAENFGEAAYTAHQSLVLLIQVLQDGHRPDIVVFYDGVNEVSQKCRTEHTPWSHGREQRISNALRALKVETSYDLRYIVRPFVASAYRVRKVLFGRKQKDESKFFNCDSDTRKAQKIADNLIEDWAVARKLVESYNGKFVGILQPVSYFSKTKTDQIAKDMTSIDRKQFQTVYPLIKQKMVNRTGVYDFTDVLDRPEYIYIDFCHLSPNGNKYVAQRMLKTLEADGTIELSQDSALRSTQARH